MPAYNAEGYIGEVIESILSQTYSDFELIILDDGSKDKTADVIKKYAKIDDRIRYYHQPNAGAEALGETINTAIGYANGEWIARADSDDPWFRYKLEKQVAFIDSHKGYVLVGGSTEIIDHDGKYLWTHYTPMSDRMIRRSMTLYTPFDHGSVMFRRDIWEKVGGYQNVAYVEDFDLWQRMSEHGKVYNLPLPVFHYRLNPGGISLTHKEVQIEAVHQAGKRYWDKHRPGQITRRAIKVELAEAKREAGENAGSVSWVFLEDIYVIATKYLKWDHNPFKFTKQVLSAATSGKLGLKVLFHRLKSKLPRPPRVPTTILAGGLLSLLFSLTLPAGLVPGALFAIGCIGTFYGLIWTIISLCGFRLDFSRRQWMLIFAIFIILSGLAVFVAASSQTVYVWDHVNYWRESIQWSTHITQSTPWNNLAVTVQRIGLDDYNPIIQLLNSITLAILGKSYAAFILTCIWMFIFPATLIITQLIKKLLGRIKQAPRLSPDMIVAVIISSAAIVQAAFVGFYDSAVLIPAAALIYVLFTTNLTKYKPVRCILLSILFLMILLMRRYFGFFIVGVVVALVVKLALDSIAQRQHTIRSLAQSAFNLLTIGLICGSILVVGFWPLIQRTLFVDYTDIYSGWQQFDTLGNIWHIAQFFGLIAIILALCGLVFSIANKVLRSTGIFLGASLLVAVLTFIRTQTMGEHHHYILVIPMAILVVLGVIGILQWSRARLAQFALAVILALNFTSIFIPSLSAVIFPSYKIAPIVRNDLDVLQQIVSDINIEGYTTYVFKSGEEFNSDTLHRLNLPGVLDSAPNLIVPSDSDLRDGFPVDLFTANQVLIPVGVNEGKDNRVTTVLVDEILSGTGIASKYKLIHEYQLDNSQVRLYLRVDEYTIQDGERLSGIFDTLYPAHPELFGNRIMTALIQQSSLR